MSDKFCQICGAWMWPRNDSNTGYVYIDCDNKRRLIDASDCYIEVLFNEMVKDVLEKEGEMDGKTNNQTM
jgi:hypothetical protein